MKKTLFLLILVIVTGCKDDVIYTLYRSSITDENLRIHVATFDVKESAQYNNENCKIASELFEKQTGVRVKYWCEKGSYKK
jgi:hypothetical protein